MENYEILNIIYLTFYFYLNTQYKRGLEIKQILHIGKKFSPLCCIVKLTSIYSIYCVKCYEFTLNTLDCYVNQGFCT